MAILKSLDGKFYNITDIDISKYQIEGETKNGTATLNMSNDIGWDNGWDNSWDNNWDNSWENISPTINKDV